MPLYDYKCTSCSHQYEMREGFDAPPRQPCPQCGNEAKRVLHPPPIVFKGSGFYITDSRKGSQATLAENSRWDTASEANKTAESPAPASDSKTAPATPAKDSAASSD
ncbi:MAG TPA: FmdB family zinc ribbon protein [Dehalococcoidia bacterium]|nr:FmdB family zinc ribbon protein [Dehalococcoidia bacterium]